jgi:nitrogen regulatory protein PII-like uncharacterized protein
MENKKYVVKVINVFANYVEVDAENEEKAKEAAKNILSSEDITQSFKHYYEATIPPEHWGVLNKEEFDKLQELDKAEQKI